MNQGELERIRKGFWEEVESKGGCMEYDFTRPEHRHVYYSELGISAEIARDEYPHIYDAVENAKTVSSTYRDNGKVGFEDNFTVEFDRVKPSAAVRAGTDSAASTAMKSESEGDYVEVKKIIVLNMRMVNLSDPKSPELAANPFNRGQKYISSELTMQPNVQIKRSQYQTTGTFSCTDIHGNKETPRAKISKTLEQEGDDIIDSVAVDAPKKIHSPATNSRVIVCYNRTATPTESADYSFASVGIAGSTTKQISVHMPFKGSLTISDEWLIQSVDEDACSIYIKLLNKDQGGSAFFNPDGDKLSQIFTISDNKKSLSWDFAKATSSGKTHQNWKKILEAKDVDNNTIVTFYCHLVLKVSPCDLPGQIFTAESVIKSSDNAKSSGPNATVPQILLWWGCLGKDSMVTMDDGKHKPISQIKKGDMVKTADNCVKMVECVFSGSEKTLIYLETEGERSLMLTDSHPVLTGRGMVRAGDLTAADEIQTESGLKAVRSIYTKEYNDTVYSLKFDRPCNLDCNGITVGDFETQQAELEYEARKWTQNKALHKKAMEPDDLTRELLLIAERRNNALAATESQPARAYYACAFPGSNDYGAVYMEKTGEFFDEPFSLELWANIQGESRSIVSQEKGFTFGADAKTVLFGCVGSEMFAMHSPFELRNDWHQYFVTYDGETLKMGIDGMVIKEFDEVSGTRFVKEDTVYIGRGFTGYIRRVKLYNAAIDPAVLRTVMFRNVLCENEDNLVFFADFTAGDMRDIGPNNFIIRGMERCMVQTLSSCYLPSKGRYAKLEVGGHINPGGFKNGSFGIYFKIYTQYSGKDKFVLLSNGRFGEEDSVIVYSAPETNQSRSIYVALGRNEYKLANGIQNYKWADLLIVFDALDNTLTAYLDAKPALTVNCGHFHRQSIGNVYIGNGFDADASGNDYTCDYPISLVAIFDAALNIENAENFYREQPYLFDKNLVALYNFDNNSACEMVSRQRLNIDLKDISPVSGTVSNLIKNRYNYAVDVDVSKYDRNAEILYKLLAAYFEKTFGLATTGHTKEIRNTICWHLEQTLLNHPDVKKLFETEVTDKLLYRMIMALDNVAVTDFFGTAHANNAFNRDESNFADKIGINIAFASANAVASVGEHAALFRKNVLKEAVNEMKKILLK